MKSQLPLMGAMARLLETVTPENSDGLLAIPAQINFWMPALHPVVGAAPSSNLIKEGIFVSNNRIVGPSAGAGFDTLCALSRGYWFLQYTLESHYGVAATAGGDGSSLLLNDPVSGQSFTIAMIGKGAAGSKGEITGNCWIPVGRDGWTITHNTPGTVAADFIGSRGAILVSRVL